MAAQIVIQNLPAFLETLREAQRRASDLTAPLTRIRDDWMRTNRLLFSLPGPGPWTDLSSSYKAQKLREWGFVYPLLRRSGRLKSSLTDPSDPGALAEIVGGMTLILGTRVMSPSGANYPAMLQKGTRNMDARPFLTVPKISVERWKRYLGSYVAAEARASLASGGGGRGGRGRRTPMLEGGTTAADAVEGLGAHAGTAKTGRKVPTASSRGGSGRQTSMGFGGGGGASSAIKKKQRHALGLPSEPTKPKPKKAR